MLGDGGSESPNAAPWDPLRLPEQMLELRNEKVVLFNTSTDCKDGSPPPPFQGMAIDSTEELGKVSGRQACHLCRKSRKYFCYSCCVPLESTAGLIPRLQCRLPCLVDIVKHPREIDGKSTAVHAKVIAHPEDVRIYIHPDIPDYGALRREGKENVVLVYPGKASMSIKEAFATTGTGHHHQGRETGSVFPTGPAPTRVVFIDSTWNQTPRLYSDPRISCLPQVRLDRRHTLFWRYQTGKSTEYLATIEAIYFLLIDYQEQVKGRPYGGEFDNLLFLFKFMFEKIHRIYDRSRLRAYNRKCTDFAGQNME